MLAKLSTTDKHSYVKNIEMKRGRGRMTPLDFEQGTSYYILQTEGSRPRNKLKG